LTGYHGFVTSAGYIGPNARVDHDISLLVPEVWCRMSVHERDPAFLISEGYLEKCQDLEHLGKKVLSSRLGYRITQRFVRAFFGRLFNHPHVVFPDEMLRPEMQDMDVFVDGMDNIIVTQQRVAQQYFNDGSIQDACPPLRALLHIMRDGNFEGKDLDNPAIRKLFTADNLLSSDWYEARLKAKQQADVQLWQRHVRYLQAFLTKSSYAEEAERLGITQRLAEAKETLVSVGKSSYLKKLTGSLGTDPAALAAATKRPAKAKNSRISAARLTPKPQSTRATTRRRAVPA
jgi:hypothetical protein